MFSNCPPQPASAGGEKFTEKKTIKKKEYAIAIHGKTSSKKNNEREKAETLNPGTGGIISVDKNGAIYLGYNTAGMFRGMADSEGEFKVALWQ